jgi:hypothetical protein
MADYTVFLLLSRAHSKKAILIEYIRNHIAKVQQCLLFEYNKKSVILDDGCDREENDESKPIGGRTVSEELFSYYCFCWTLKDAGSEER